MNNHIDTSELKQIIMQILALTPQGKVTTNGQVARFCGYPSYSRYIGSVFKKLPHNTRLS
jgi:alkylated DNA nucleotide flippase Atl1